MKTPIDEALDYLESSDHRYQTSLVGGTLLLVAQYVFLYSGSSHVAVRSVGIAAAVLLVGYVVTVIRHVYAGHDQPPSFTPVRLERLGSIGFDGLLGLAVLVVVVLGMYLPLTVVLSEIDNAVGPVGVGTPLVWYFLVAVDLLAYAYVLFLIPYVSVAAFLVLGGVRRPTPSRLIEALSDVGTVPGPVVATKAAISGARLLLSWLRLLLSWKYAYGWVLAAVLLLFNTDSVFLVSDIVFDIFVSDIVFIRQVFRPAFGSGSVVSAFFSFYVLVSVTYLFASRDPKRSEVDERVLPANIYALL